MEKLLVTGSILVMAPGLALAHPGHGLDGLWVHEVLHTLTALTFVALVSLVGWRVLKKLGKRDDRQD